MWKTLGKTTWEEIEINEVFAVNGCWQIGYKLDDCSYILLAEDYTIQSETWDCLKEQFTVAFNILSTSTMNKYSWDASMELLYKLPMSIQKLFKEV